MPGPLLSGIISTVLAHALSPRMAGVEKLVAPDIRFQYESAE